MGVYDDLKKLVEEDVPTTLESLNTVIGLINGELGSEATATPAAKADKVLAAPAPAAKVKVNLEIILKELESKRKDILQEFKTSRADAVTEIKNKRVDAVSAINKEKSLAIQVMKGVREGALIDIANALKNAIAKITFALPSQPSGADNFNITRQPK